ncbi:MAG: hypothetical protein AUJ70_01480 [Candidatus Omnitrophica bacterium CG1_02_40_15]|nr:MAG: hypothetical protein AUJ70_01480 [Candidatus Omnitrophica bacterium CG1_02_40_15]
MQAARKIFYVLVIILATRSIALASDVRGTIGVILKSGDIKYGAKVDVYLTTKEVSVQAIGSESSYSNAYGYEKALLDSFFTVFKQVQLEMNSADYVKQLTKTDLSGKFSFKDVSPGKYFIVVTFPTTIAMHKVFGSYL